MGRSCRKCLLPDTVPGSQLDREGVCRPCQEHAAHGVPQEDDLLDRRRADLELALEDCRGRGQFDCLVNLSGGKDSCYLLYKLKRERGLNVLAYTVDVNLTAIARENIRRTVERLDVPHVMYRPPQEFYRKLFRYLLQNQQAQGAVRTVCYVCAPLYEGFSLQLAVEKRIPLVLAGYSPGQPDADRMVYEFSREMICRRDWTPPELRRSGLFSEAELTMFWNPARYEPGTPLPRYLAPFHAWPYHQGEVMKAVVRLGLVASSRHASPVHSNCPVNWLLMYSDLKNLGYNPYSPEFSRLVREGKASRAYWRVMIPLVNFMIRRQIFLGRNVKRSLQWLGLRSEQLKITEAATPADTVPGLIEQQAQRAGYRVVYRRRTGQGRWVPVSWSDFQREVRQTAAALRRGGLRRGERLAIIAPTSHRWLLAEMAALTAGCVVVGIDPTAPPEQIGPMLEDCRATGLVVGDRAVLARVPRAMVERMKMVVVLDEVESSFSPPLPEGEGASAHPNPLPEGEGTFTHNIPHLEGGGMKRPLPDDPAVRIYTSGTTGSPKAIEYTHGQLIAACRSIGEALPQLTEGDTTVCWLPMAHLYQRMLNLVAMSRGVELHFVEDPREIMSAVKEVRPAVFVGVPRIFEKLYEAAQQRLTGSWPWKKLVMHRVRRMMGPKLKLMISGSAPLAPHIVRFFHGLGLPLLEAYGISENVVPMSMNRLDAWRAGSVGRPLSANEIRVDADGEILVRGPGVFRGYSNDGSLERPAADGFYRTGDLGYLDTDGYLFLTGRKSELIKTSTGRRLVPQRIEAAYARGPYIEQAVVVGNGRRRLIGLLTLRGPRIRQWLAERGESSEVSDERLPTVPAVAELIRQEVDRLGRDLASWERIADFAVLPGALSIDRGEVTPTQKLCRHRIEANYADLIERLDEPKEK